MSDAWDLVDLKIPGRDPDLKTLLHYKSVYREWDTDYGGFQVRIDTNVAIKTVNEPEQGSIWHMTCYGCVSVSTLQN